MINSGGGAFSANHGTVAQMVVAACQLDAVAGSIPAGSIRRLGHGRRTSLTHMVAGADASQAGAANPLSGLV